MMLSIAVCDDEITECQKLSVKIQEMLLEMKMPCIIRQFYNGNKLLDAIEGFDIIFLDILMSGANGLETAKIFRKRAFDKILIFVSSSRDYVFDAYDVEAYHYLVKPVEDRKLKKVLQGAVHKTEKQPNDFLLVSRNGELKKLFLQDVCYFEIRGRILSAHKKDGILDFYEQIGILEKKLSGKGFFRCHKSYLVNLKYVDGYTKQDILLENGERIVVSKRRLEQFRKELFAFMKKSGGMA
ncbi:DNA-binding response regulator [bacterium D16-51]|nr:DNA-binding response regulator [bacterium D16-59]RKI57447.1 DNA-binding response regulator [bacterium D16-51]